MQQLGILSLSSAILLFMEVIKDNLIFSVYFENYEKNILKDKEDRTLGEWHINDENINNIKYAYAYLTGSGQMLVKKFWIEKFVHSDVEKGYANPDKYCLIFSKSEDIKILYSGVPVQGRQLQTSDEMDKMKVIDESDVDWRFQQSSGELQNRYAHKTKKQMTSKDYLVKSKVEDFPDKFLPNVKFAKELIARVDNGESAKDVLESFYKKKES